MLGESFPFVDSLNLIHTHAGVLVLVELTDACASGAVNAVTNAHTIVTAARSNKLAFG